MAGRSTALRGPEGWTSRWDDPDLDPDDIPWSTAQEEEERQAPGPAGTADEPDFSDDDDRRSDAPGGLNLDNLPTALNANALRPRVVLHYHLSDTGLAAFGDHTLVRPEHSDPTTFKVLLNFLAGTGCQIKIQPVINPAAVAPVDAYEIPDKIRNAVRYRDIADTAPWGSCTSRSMDLDHTKPYQHDGPPGQTGPGNLGPQTRTPHRIKTLGIARVRQPDPGVFFWRTPHGHTAITTNRGTLYLGATDFSRALWDLTDRY